MTESRSCCSKSAAGYFHFWISFSKREQRLDGYAFAIVETWQDGKCAQPLLERSYWIPIQEAGLGVAGV